MNRIFKNYKQFMDWDIILILIAFAGSLVFYDLEVVSVIGMIGLIIVGYFLGFRWISRMKNDQNKKPLVVTARIKRLIFTILVLYFIPLCLMCYYMVDKEFFWQMLFVITFMIYFNTFVVYLANIINLPVEKLVYLYYKSKAQGKLKRMNNLKIIGNF